MMDDVAKDRVWTQELLQSPHQTADKASRVRKMFNAIAPRYELVNSLFSFGRDAAWRRKAVTMAAVRPHDDVLDVACGTGDFARAFAVYGPRGIVGCDFAHEMLVRAKGSRAGESAWVEADALRLPFDGGSFSIVSCAFGVRNFADLAVGLAEFHRVLRSGGRVVILEFTRPPSRLFRGCYELYSNRFMPIAASWISGDRTGAYRYLPRSVVSFPDARELCGRLTDAGFTRVQTTPMTLGVVTAYVAYRD